MPAIAISATLENDKKKAGLPYLKPDFKNQFLTNFRLQSSRPAFLTGNTKLFLLQRDWPCDAKFQQPPVQPAAVSAFALRYVRSI